MRARQKGLTLIEVMVAVAIVAILTAAALPSFQQIYLKVRLEGTANQLRTDLQYARSESMRLRNTVSIASTGSGTGYALTDGAGNQLKSNSFAAGTSISQNVTVVYDPLRGFATTTGSFTLAATNLTGSITVSVDDTGRVTSCSTGSSFYGVTNSC